MKTLHAQRSPRRRLHTSCALATALACWQLAGCSSGSEVKTEAELTRHIATLIPPGTDAQAARSTLTEQGFTCIVNPAGQITCQRKLPGVVCNQVQFAFLPASGPVPADLKTKLDSICL